ncbi:MAG: hypothetical protein ABSH08_03540 [Tepidisphaeraceae bacterium]
MTRLMEQAIERLRAIPAAQQDEVARFLIGELEEDIRWSQSTAKHQDKLQGLMDEVLKDDARGACEPLDPDKL